VKYQLTGEAARDVEEILMYSIGGIREKANIEQ
jgi:hypothetical protein